MLKLCALNVLKATRCTSLIVRERGSATGNAAEAVFKSNVAGEAVSAGYGNGMGNLTDYHMQ